MPSSTTGSEGDASSGSNPTPGNAPAAASASSGSFSFKKKFSLKRTFKSTPDKSKLDDSLGSQKGSQKKLESQGPKLKAIAESKKEPSLPVPPTQPTLKSAQAANAGNVISGTSAETTTKQPPQQQPSPIMPTPRQNIHPPPPKQSATPSTPTIPRGQTNNPIRRPTPTPTTTTNRNTTTTTTPMGATTTTMNEDADSAFLKALRGAAAGTSTGGGRSSSIHEDAGMMYGGGGNYTTTTTTTAQAAARSVPTAKTSASDADSAFLKALRGGDNDATASASPAPTSAGAENDSDSAFLRAFRGADFTDVVVGNTDNDGGSKGSATTASSTTTKKRAGKVQPPMTTNRARAAVPAPTSSPERKPSLSSTSSSHAALENTSTGSNGDDANNAFLRALRGGDNISTENESGSTGHKGRGGGKVQPPVATNRTSRPAPSAADTRNEADSAFLRAFHGGGGDVGGGANTTAKGGGTTTTAKKASASTGAAVSTGNGNDADSAFLRALREATDDNTTLSEAPRQALPPPAKPVGMSNADVDFLAAMRGSPVAATHPLSSPSSQSPTNQNNRHPLAKAGKTSAFPTPPMVPNRTYGRQETDGSDVGNDNELSAGSFVFTSKNKQTKKVPSSPSRTKATTPADNKHAPSEDIDYANAAFLGALHASSDTPDDVQGDNRRSQQPDGSFILNSRAKMPQRRSGDHVAVTATPQVPTHHAKLSTPSDADSAFLMAVHGSQSSSHIPSPSIQSYSSGYQDSGTLVLSSPKVVGGDAVKGAKNEIDHSKAAFMMAIHASSDDGYVASDLSKKSFGDGIVDEAKDDGGATVEVEDEEDDDTEELEVPSQPFMEKVYLPRPLFFGHVLPPRVMEEAVRASSVCVLESQSASAFGEGGMISTAISSPEQLNKEKTELSHEHPLKASFSREHSDTATTLSRSISSSFSTLGVKNFNTSLLPCYRNLEGAIEAFGFGINPFTADNKLPEEEKGATTEPNAPHPYVSVYSPVWDDWGRRYRAKAKRKRDKLEGAKIGAVPPSNLAETSTQQPMAPIKQQPDQTTPRTTTKKHPLAESTSSGSQIATNREHDDESTTAEPTVSSGETRSVTSDSTHISQDQFARFAQGLEDFGGSGGDTFVGKPKVELSDKRNVTPDNTHISQDQFARFACAEPDEEMSDFGGNGGDTFVGKPKVEVSYSGTFVPKPSSQAFGAATQFDSSTFVQAVKGNDGSDDSDSIEAAEEFQFVGLNDNISAAAAMLAGEGVDDDVDGNVRMGIGTCITATGGGAKSVNKYGRPYSNIELTNGCVPQFGCDDPSLPHEGDLGVFETKEEEKKSMERRRQKDIIEDLAVPGLMAHITCPTQSTDVDDSQTWNSRLVENDAGNNRSNANTVLISLDGNSTVDPQKLTGTANERNKSPIYETSRVGWWNLPDNLSNVSSSSSKPSKKAPNSRNPSPNVEVFPACDDPIPLDVQTNLWPSAQILRENNFSATRLHSATSTARLLPHLSDRPPSVRHLQIDTTAVGFPKLGGETEPIFCKLAIYHFEMNAEGSTNGSNHRDGASVSSGVSSTPSPNMERCGRVTESLSFDVVQDPAIIETCKRALWPYAEESRHNGLSVTPGVSSRNKDDVRLEGTPCGIFPLPANLNISNLCVVITVHKVLSDPADLQPYFKNNRREVGEPKPKYADIDLEKLRENAGKASDKFGQFITPFAFGVVPLMHIIGNEAPKVPMSRAVQTPLFKFVPGRGPQCILDHILYIFHPRAEPRIGKAASMTRGHALLVMRYFGFLGLHSIVEKKSSLARDRLVDFTGELQVRRKEGKDAAAKNTKEACPVLGENYILPPWRQQFVVEPAQFGGRNVPMSQAEVASKGNESTNNIYAQEIAALPLERLGLDGSSSRGRSRSSSSSKNFDGTLLHTSFCNELVCQPKILQKCPKKNIVIKVELRELQWSESLKVDVAIPVEPSIHNTRRGPWLVQEAFSSCALGAAEPQFLDEFKIKLPLVLGESGHEKIGLFFSVYHITVKKKRLNGIQAISKRRSVHAMEDFVDPIEHIGSGFLPLTLEDSPTCLLSNGDHKVPINLRTIQLVDTADGTSLQAPAPAPIRHRKSSSFSGTIGRHIRSWSGASDEIKVSLSNEAIEENGAPTEFPSTTVKYPKGTLALGRLQGRNVDLGDSGEDSDGSEDSFKSDSGTSRVLGTSRLRRATFDSVRRGTLVGGLRPVVSSGNLSALDSSSRSLTSDPIEKNMILQINIVAFSSVHPQNKALADLFQTKPKIPRSVSSPDFSERYTPWGKFRSEILYRLKPERIPPLNFVGGPLAETERKLLEPVIALSKSSKCPHSDLMPHVVRVVAQLWRTMVAGVGEPSMLWASPESLIPLRLNAFATLLHTVSSASYHMAKSGRQLDGNTKWNLTALGKMLVMLFDEQSILGGPLEMPPTPNEKKTSPATSPLSDAKELKKPAILSSRSKTSDETKSTLVTSKPAIISRFSSEEGHKKFDVDAMLKSSQQYQRDTLLSNAGKSEKLGNETDDSNNPTSGDSGFKVDSKSDFMSALTATSLDVDSDASPSKSANRSTDMLLNSFGTSSSSFGPAANRRRWMTLPSNALATIQENDSGDSRLKLSSVRRKKEVEGDALDAELILHQEKVKPLQFRVPQVKPSDEAKPMSSFLDDYTPPASIKKEDKEVGEDILDNKQRSLPKDNDEIESAGTAFLDTISKQFGQGLSGKVTGGEEKRVGAAHHRKTRSRCSIDWSLPPTDMLLEKDQQMERLNRTRFGVGVAPKLALGPISSFVDDGSTDEDATGNDSIDGSLTDKKVDISCEEVETITEKVHPLKRHSHSASVENPNANKTADAIVLPDFADRMSAMKNDGKTRRWWPYVYEVVIYQWLALLVEQTKKADSGISKTRGVKHGLSTPSELNPIVVKYLSHAAKAARGATIRCAPYLLEIITQSLSWRVNSIYRGRKSEKSESNGKIAPLVKLDENIISALEELITMLTDASIDSRNFDSFEFRKISIDVNDAVVKFLRDLFSILDIQSVHRLILVYFSRFVTKEGKHWHDRDSKVTGLRCSWETTKLRLNAVALFVRFPEFMNVNLPLMESWESWPVGSSVKSTRRFFSVGLEKISSLGMGEFSSSEGPVRKEPLIFPKLKPHWLAELCTDICLAATGHAEKNIQHRASSLLFELFWRHSQQGRANGNISVAASVFVSFIPKVLGHMTYLSSLPAKSQLRKDIIPCALLVLQSAPVGLMRALWRKLANRAEGKTHHKDSAERYGGIIGSGSGIGNIYASSSYDETFKNNADDFEMDSEPDIYDMFGLLNMSLATIEYEGNEKRVDDTNGEILDCNENPSWRKEFLLSLDRDQMNASTDQRRFPMQRHESPDSENVEKLSTHNSRRWHAHDCAIVIIHTCRHMVRETLGMIRPSTDAEDSYDGGSLEISGSRTLSDVFLQHASFSSSVDDTVSGPFHEEKKQAQLLRRLDRKKMETLTFSVIDTIIFVRAATSVYLHALTMKQSDVVIVKTLTAAVEIVKIFGIKVFLSAVGETLQHWMRVILEHCGARRAEVRVEASEFLNLLLRLTWDSYGSFFRVRLPLLAVQTEVMERIVAKAATKYVMEQRRLGLNPIILSNDSAEASLTPMWRTIHRLHNQSVSRNLSFKSALARLALVMKKLYKAYLAAHALAIVNRSELSGSHAGDVDPSQINPYVQRMRVSVHRIVSNAAGFSKQFLGNQASVSLDRSSIQTEAVEDSFLSAADVFSSTELPSHRVAWLQKLAEFHRMRGRFAEEATCRCYIYHTYREAAKQHDHIWSSSPFLPWASNSTDGMHPDGEGPAGEAIFSDFDYEMENLSVSSGKHGDKNTSFRRIFYRAADSVRVRTGDWGVVGGGRYLFYGVAMKSEFDSVSPWYSLREMEENMVEEAETCGDLYLRAGIVESSRYSWSLATQFYSETFNYARLAYVYRRLALVVTSQIPVVDKSSQIDLTSPIGRFYKVYFHGGAPDDLNGIEFVYRAPNSAQIKDFGSRLESAVRSILPNKTTIDLVLDDGSPTMTPKAPGNKRQPVIGGAPIEPIKIKVTPLRPLFKMEDTEKCFRGTPEWFQLRTEEYDYVSVAEGRARRNLSGSSLHQRHQSLSTTNTFSSVGSFATPARRSSLMSRYRNPKSQHNLSNGIDQGGVNGELIGVDRFYFTQPQRKDPIRGFRDWLKVPKGRFAERSLRVTELQVENCFPACVTRQKIIHRAVFTQSPLEASVEAVSTWCSVLFRTVIATNGLSVLGGQRDQGLSANAAKVLADCIHSSGVKQIGKSFLTVNTQPDDSNNDAGMMMYESSKTVLSEEEIEKVQIKLARIIVIFLEMLHLLIARNRDVLLGVVQARKRKGGDTSSMASGSVPATSRTGSNMKSHIGRQSNDSYYYDRSSGDIMGKSIVAENQVSYGHHSNNSDRTDAAIGVQSELQRGFIGLVKALSPSILDTINNEAPRWLRQCHQENYFSSGLYRQAVIPIADELFFNVDASSDEDRGSNKTDSSYEVPRSIIDRGSTAHHYKGSSPNGSLCSDQRRQSTMSDRVVIDRSTHRRTPSGASYASSIKNAF